ncbi:MAG: hypothetical protein HRT72_08565 [Flavobacteriales bacterium]|nr:hypothetical protein [Flavobacteriales bacterium]
MSLLAFIRLLINHYKVLVIIPVVLMIMVLLLMDDNKRNYLTTTTIYTGFASGSSVEGDRRTDFFAIKTKFDNLFENMKSRSTREEIILRTLSFYLSKDVISEQDMSSDNQELLAEILPKEFTDQLVVKQNEEATYLKLYEHYHSSYENEIYYLLNSTQSLSSDYFGLDKLLSLSGMQEGNSDLVVFSYETSDAGICYHTIRIALSVILTDVKTIRSAESWEVVQYFLRETAVAKTKLDTAEEQLSELMTEQKVINYYEQTKYLAHRREEFEVAFQGEKLQLAAAVAAKEEAENKMSLGEGIKLKNQSILSIRKKLRDVTSQIAFIEISQKAIIELPDSLEDNNPSEMRNDYFMELKAQSDKLKEQLNDEVSQLYDLRNSSNGLAVKSIVDSWLQAAIKEEEYTARIYQYIAFRQEFEENYTKFSSLGSSIKQMERRINMLEEDYLSLMESLNEARLKQESIERLTSLKIVDHPFYPVNAEKSKKPVFMLLAFFTGLILTLSLLLVLEYLDDTIKSPRRLQKLSGLKLAGGLPILKTDKEPLAELLYNKLLNQMIARINHNYYESESQQLLTVHLCPDVWLNS